MSTGFARLASRGQDLRERAARLVGELRQLEPGASQASAQRIPSPPAFVRTATRRPRGSGCVESSTAASMSSSSVSASITPAWRNSASTAVVEPASAAVCEPAARCPARRAAALHREDRLLARDPPRDPRELARVAERLEVEETRSVLGSSSQYSSRSLDETSALFPIETNDERPRPRADACSSSASPSAPLCDEKPMFPAGRCAARTSRSGRARRRRCRGSSGRSAARRGRARARAAAPGGGPSLPVSANPAEITQSARVPFRSAASASGETARPAGR